MTLSSAAKLFALALSRLRRVRTAMSSPRTLLYSGAVQPVTNRSEMPVESLPSRVIHSTPIQLPGFSKSLSPTKLPVSYAAALSPTHGISLEKLYADWNADQPQPPNSASPAQERGPSPFLYCWYAEAPLLMP